MSAPLTPQLLAIHRAGDVEQRLSAIEPLAQSQDIAEQHAGIAAYVETAAKHVTETGDQMEILLTGAALAERMIDMHPVVGANVKAPVLMARQLLSDLTVLTPIITTATLPSAWTLKKHYSETLENTLDVRAAIQAREEEENSNDLRGYAAEMVIRLLLERQALKDGMTMGVPVHSYISEDRGFENRKRPSHVRPGWDITVWGQAASEGIGIAQKIQVKNKLGTQEYVPDVTVIAMIDLMLHSENSRNVRPSQLLKDFDNERRDRPDRAADIAATNLDRRTEQLLRRIGPGRTACYTTIANA